MTQLTIAQLTAQRRRELKANPVRLFRIDGTPYKVAVPYSIEINRYAKTTVDLFGRKLDVLSEPRGTRPGVLKPIDPLPESWFVELGAC